MASQNSGTSVMVVPYQWILNDVENEPKTFVSKMILFRGGKVFRVGLKNLVDSQVLFFMAVDFNKMGMKVEGVTYGIQESDTGPESMKQMAKVDIGDEGSLQLFTINLAELVTGNKTFVFRICIEGSVPDYSYQLSDRLAKDQLSDAAIVKSQKLVDVELVVKDKTFHSHKAILAARSPVFAAIFKKEQPAVGDVGPHQIRIDGVEPSTVKHFLHFIYTGESMGPLANEELLKLADQYQLTTLSGLCRVALKKIEPMQMVNLDRKLNKEAKLLSSIIRPDKESEIVFDRTTPTFRCDWTFDLVSNDEPSKCIMKYQNEDICFAYYTDEDGDVRHPWFHCLCAKHRSCGLEVEDIYLSDNQRENWFKMEAKIFRKNTELLHFFSHSNVYSNDSARVCFDIKIVSTVNNYYYEMMDDSWMKDIWLAATNQMFTDAEIFVGTVKLMEAHRIILCARSPGLKALLSKISNTEKSIVTFSVEFDVDVVKHFLKFLYTGSLETSASDKQLLKLATKFEVETLKNMCELANQVPDVEEFINSMLQL